MGLGTSCRIFTEVSNALAWAFRKNNPKAAIFNYLDDFLILAESREECQSALRDYLDCLNNIGFPVSNEKTVYPCQNLEFLGLGVNAHDLSFFIPDTKRDKALEMITQFMAKKHQKVHTFQKL